MRLFKAAQRLIAELCLLITAVAKQNSRRRVVFATAAMAAILAAFLIWDASAGATLPGKPVSMKAGAASW